MPSRMYFIVFSSFSEVNISTSTVLFLISRCLSMYSEILIQSWCLRFSASCSSSWRSASVADAISFLMNCMRSCGFR